MSAGKAVLAFGSDNRDDLLYNAWCVTTLLADTANTMAEPGALAEESAHGLCLVLQTVANTINQALETG